MAYDEFKITDVKNSKIATNARKFGTHALSNEALLSEFFTPKFDLSEDERKNIEQIFLTLMKVEQEIQLSKS